MPAPEYITQNTGLVHIHAKRFTWACGGCIDYDDLVQAGNIGLMYAAEHYSASRGKFSTFAALCIRTKIQEEVESKSRTINLPTSYRRRMWKQGKPINPHGLSLDSAYENARSPLETLASDDDPHEQLELDESHALVESVRAFIAEHFSERTKQILMEVYFEGATPADVATRLGISRERVRQLCAAGIEVIRRHIGVEL